ncbi:MAG TPA: hypothetical protein DDE71_00290, partial [Tenacibaculum sp.]|nr:hypothetical protein [Tenacibaculum sp.]
MKKTKNLFLLNILFLIGLFSAFAQDYTPRFYIKGTRTEVKNFMAETEYYAELSSSVPNSNQRKNYIHLKNNSYQKIITPNFSGASSQANFFSFTNSEINKLNSNQVFAEVRRDVRQWKRVCVRLCNRPGMAEYQSKWVVVSTSTVQFKNLNLKVNGKTPTPNSINQVQNTNCVTNTNISVQFRCNQKLGTIYKWYKNNNLFSTTSSNTSSFVSVSDNDIISVSHTDTNYNESLKRNITVSVVQKGNAPSINTSSVCKGDKFNITASTNSLEVEWFEDSRLNNQITNGLSNKGKTLSYPANFTGNKTLYARGKNKNCYTNVSSINLSVFSQPTVDSVTGENQGFCGNNATFKVNGRNIDRVIWYKGIEGLPSQIISTKNSFNYDIGSLQSGNNSIYFIAKTNNNCSTSIQKVNFIKIANSGTVSTVSNTEYCTGERVNILLSSSTSVRYEWYEDQNMNIPVPSNLIQKNGSVLTYTASNTGTKKRYYRGVNNQGCYTKLYSINIKINQSPSNLQITNSNGSFCVNNKAEFEASANNATSYKFYKNSSGTLPWTSPNVSRNKISFDTSNLLIGKNKFWVKAINNSGCVSDLKEVSFTIKPIPN